MNNRKQSKGFSLVELLVAMAIGLIVVSGAFSLHVSSRKTQAVNEMQMDMVADARFALEVITYDLRHAGMYGGTNKDGLIECRSTDASCVGADKPAVVAGDCAIDWSYNLSQPVFATDGSVGNPYSGSCIPAGEGYVAGSDVLDIRYADSNFLDPITGLAKVLVADQSYVRSNFSSGKVFTGIAQPTIGSYDSDPITQNYVLHAFTYYVSNFTDSAGDNIPSLRRVSLVNGPALQQQTLISGVSDMQVQFGEDVTGDMVIDRYVDPQNVTDWTAVYAAKIWLIMRSDKRQIGVDTKKSFSIAGAVAKDYGGPDDYRYFLVTSVVDLRNMRQL